MKFSPEEVWSVWAIVASSLHLGNLTFDESTLTDSMICFFLLSN